MDIVTQNSEQPTESNVLPTVGEWDNPDRYAARWISRAIAQTGVEAPDSAQAGEHTELLTTLHDAYLTGGPTAAAAAWKPVSKYLTALAALVRQPDRTLIHANELINLPRPTYYIDEYPLYEGGLNVIVGESGSGKSFLALDIAARVGDAVNVIYIVGEGLYGYAGRWEAWKQHHNQDANLWFYPKELNFSDVNELATFVDMVSDKRPKLIIVDTVARCMGELDENSTKDMGLFIMRTSYLRQQLGCGVLLVHHTGKNGIMRGSSALYGAADGILFASKTDEVISIYNDRDRGGKNKDAKPWEPMYRQMLPVTVERGDEVLESVVLVPSEKIEYDLSDDDALTEKQREIVETLTSLGDCTAKEIIESTSLPMKTTYRNLKQLIKKGVVAKLDSGAYSLIDEG